MEDNITKIEQTEKKGNQYPIALAIVMLCLLIFVLIGLTAFNIQVTNNCTEDTNKLVTAGQTAMQHLSICRQTVFCVNDWNACPVKENISDYAALCLITDQNLLNIYKVFERN